LSPVYAAHYLKLSLVSCPIALYAGTSATERVTFRQINRKTGNRLRQQLVDEVTRESGSPMWSLTPSDFCHAATISHGSAARRSLLAKPADDCSKNYEQLASLSVWLSRRRVEGLSAGEAPAKTPVPV
jgi:hypothetical protein